MEKLDELTRQGANTALVNALATAGTLVGREVTANRDGVPVTTVVQRSTIREGRVVLETARGEIALEQIVSVGATVPAPEPPGPAPAPDGTEEPVDAPDGADEPATASEPGSGSAAAADSDTADAATASPAPSAHSSPS